MIFDGELLVVMPSTEKFMW